jgi:hypothetical protein
MHFSVSTDVRFGAWRTLRRVSAMSALPLDVDIVLRTTFTPVASDNRHTLGRAKVAAFVLCPFYFF